MNGTIQDIGTGTWIVLFTLAISFWVGVGLVLGWVAMIILLAVGFGLLCALMAGAEEVDGDE